MPMATEKELLHCYNLGCGQKYDPEDNKEDSCIFHPGAPFFHDAYKGWSCCKKKCTDFTEFLNIKGCEKSFHSNVKPQVEKPIVDKSKADEVIVYKAPQPMVQPSLKRPPLDSQMVDLKPAVIAPSLKQSAASVEVSASSQTAVSQNELQIGMPCKNKGCKQTYEGEASKYEDCTFHPGVPVFHEGLKFWSCCTRRTSDFNAFLEQKGCNVGKHKWFEDKSSGADGSGGNSDGSSKLQYRYDWHQTGSHVVVAVYAKNYDPVETTVKLNPVRLVISIQDTVTAKTFDLDIHLRGCSKIL
ncbi:cysteine and histidine-rich domain-containing protein morgana isoform X2 [Hetaerina americana]|uniref:cysteine and histidine-rich domain-containing protein morgana isoform X2 n=1 Tax=Hetaerina americana TaxID=62018 RepID=UPI003A7F2B09